MNVLINADENCSNIMENFLNQKKVLKDINTKIKNEEEKMYKLYSLPTKDESGSYTDSYIQALEANIKLFSSKRERDKTENEILVANNIVTLLRNSVSSHPNLCQINRAIKMANRNCKSSVVLDSLMLDNIELKRLKTRIKRNTKNIQECIVPVYKREKSSLIITDFKAVECYSTDELWEIADLIL